MPSNCAVAECKNTSLLKKQRPELIHHAFPESNEEICKIWIHRCKRKDRFNYLTSYVCSDHFTTEDYERDLRNELLNIPIRKKLKKTAVPSVFPERCKNQVSNSLRTERANSRSRKHFVNQIIFEKAPDTTPDVPEDETVVDNFQQSCENTSVLEKENEQLKLRIGILEDDLRQKKRVITSLKVQNKALRLRLKHKSTAKSVGGNKLLSGVFSKTQVKKLSGKKRVKWTTEDIVRALSVRSVSLKAYETARSCWKLPLPAVRTLRMWTRNFACQSGLLNEVLQIMKQEATSMKMTDRICVLSFDEMSINSRFVLDKTENMIVSSSKVQVIMARGICQNWKQPIYFEFDKSMSVQILFDVIKSLEESRFPVHAITSDMGAENRSLWNQLNIDIGSNKFQNPVVSSRFVHVFADVPHMLKLIRNHILDDGILLGNSILNKQTFHKIIEYDNTEIKLCPKLSVRILELHGAERMRVSPAAQLLSHHVGTLARKVFPGQPEYAEFICTINNGFDVLNSRVPKDSNNKFKSGFGMAASEQLNVLAKLKSYMQNCKFLIKGTGNLKRALLPCQRGFIVSIESTLSLYEELKQVYSLAYVLTSRLNQDCLESLFSRIREFGGPNTCPTPPEFRYRLRLLLVGSQVRPPLGANTNFVDHDISWISTKLISKCKLSSAFSEISPNENRMIMANCESNDDAMHYLAGFIAYKLKKRNMLHGSPTAGCPGTRWIHMLSRGGMMSPSDDLFIWVKLCENVFSKMSLSHNPLTVSSLVSEIVKELPSIDISVVKEFAAIRLKIRVRHINNLSKAKSIVNRYKNKQFARSSKQTIC